MENTEKTYIYMCVMCMHKINVHIFHFVKQCIAFNIFITKSITQLMYMSTRIKRQLLLLIFDLFKVIFFQ